RRRNAGIGPDSKATVCPMARRAANKHTPKRSSNWLSIVNYVFSQWRDRVGSKDAKDKLSAMLCDRNTRCAKRRVDASGKEIPDTARFVDDPRFWPDHRDCLVVLPDADGGDQDRLVIDYGNYEDVYWDDYSPGWRWEFYVPRLDVERWER